MAQHNVLGKEGEKAVVAYLEQNGFCILEQNWFYDRYEIDIIATKDEWIVFVEVKTRTSTQWGNPEDAISKGKIKRIVEAADFYIRDKDIELTPRFDVFSVVKDGDDFEIDHIEDAFLPPVN